MLLTLDDWMKNKNDVRKEITYNIDSVNVLAWIKDGSPVEYFMLIDYGKDKCPDYLGEFATLEDTAKDLGILLEYAMIGEVIMDYRVDMIKDYDMTIGLKKVMDDRETGGFRIDTLYAKEAHRMYAAIGDARKVKRD